MSEDAATGRRCLTCGAVARLIATRTGNRPHRDTVRAWVFRWLKPGEHYTRTPGSLKINPAGIEKIVAELTELLKT